MQQQPNTPLHGKTLQMILEELVEAYRWEGLVKQKDLTTAQNNQASREHRRTPST